MELLILLLCLLPLVLGTKALWTVLVVITCALVLREALQMFASLKRYLIVIIIMISVIILVVIIMIMIMIFAMIFVIILACYQVRSQPGKLVGASSALSPFIPAPCSR